VRGTEASGHELSKRAGQKKRIVVNMNVKENLEDTKERARSNGESAGGGVGVTALTLKECEQSPTFTGKRMVPLRGSSDPQGEGENSTGGGDSGSFSIRRVV